MAWPRPADPLVLEADGRFDRIVTLAAMVFGAERAGLSVTEGEAARIVARTGRAGEDAAGEAALAGIAAANGGPLFLTDAASDPRFQGVDAPNLAFFAAVPLTGPTGESAGVLWVDDPRTLAHPNGAQRRMLCELAGLAEEALRRDAAFAAARERMDDQAGRVELALTAAQLGDFEWDISSDTMRLSPRVQAIVGWPVAVIEQGRTEGLIDFVVAEDREAVREAVIDSVVDTGRFSVECRVLRADNGRQIWCLAAGVLVADAAGRPRKLIGVIEDITDRRAAQEEREALLGELDHRVKNVLSSVQSMAAQSARKAATLEGFLKTFSGRLKSMASAHQLLTATRWRGATLLNIAAAELGGLAPGQTRWEGPDVTLTPRAANALSLALHELAANAVKFGALSTDEGRVEVRWRASAGGGIEIRWEETGGPTVTPPLRRGFGSTLLDKVTGRELEGAVVVEPRREGMRVLMTVGASAIAARAPQAPETPAEPEARPLLAGASAGGGGASGAARLDGLRVLIVEDALLLALELEAGLQDAGAEVVACAADVDEAMRALDGTTVDAAVLDANLNGVSVLPVAEALRARGVPFVFATGYGDSKILPQGFDAPVIRKPYDVTQVAAGLAEVTGRA